MADDISKRIPGFIEPFRVDPGASVKLARDFDPAFKAGIEKTKGGADLRQGRIVKLFLNLSREEQRVRFLRRIDLPDHNWKFSSHDVEERKSWDAYQEAFSEMLSHTSTEWAPWYVIPADRKWFARTAAAAVIANALIEIDPQYPKLGDDALRDLQTAKLELEQEAPTGAAADPFAAQAG
jgi:Polyphosphate kinase 2 (PPK2)